MYTLKLKAVFLITLLISSTVLVADTHPKRILFIGNSYLYYNDSIHNHVKRMLVEHYNDNEITTKSATIGGSRLHNHNVDHLLNHKNLQLDQQIDLLIMQGGSGEVMTSKSSGSSTVQRKPERSRSCCIEAMLNFPDSRT